MSRTISGIAALAAGLVLMAGPVVAQTADSHGDGQAAETAHGEEVHGEAAHGEETHEAAPNLFSVDPGLLIWTIITFVVVLVVLRLTAWGPLMSSLAERQRNIEGAIEAAQSTKAEAEALLARHQSMLEGAKDDARAILDEARKDGMAVRDGIKAAADKEAEEFKDRARREIDAQKDQAVREIWDLAGQLSTELATRILGRTLDASDQERLVRELIDELKAEVGTDGTGTESA